MLCRFEFTAFLLCRLSPEFVAVLSFSGGGTNVRCMEVADSAESLQGRARISSQNSPGFLLQILEANPGGLFACTDLLGGDTFLCVYASHTTDFISFHFIRLSYQTRILHAININVCNLFNPNHIIRVSCAQEVTKCF